MMKIIKIRIY